MMDFIFYLDSQSLREIIRSIIIPLGWTYIALWSLDQHTPDLECKGGWFNSEMETGSSRAQSVAQTLFNLYKLCRFSVDTGRVPGLALNQQPYIWLTANELLRFSSDESQGEFYRVAGIQTAVFIRCGNGVVELGTTNLVQADEQNKLRIRSLLASISASSNISVPIPGTSMSTSFCSSLLSRSIDSPGSSSMVSYVQYPIHSSLTSSMVSYLQYPTKSSPYDQINTSQDIHQYSTSSAELTSGFYPYLQMLQLPSSSGLLKRSPAMLSNIHAERAQQTSICGSYRPPAATISSGQLHHMISERRRREKLKEGFEALRLFIPTAPRKDKASLLSYTREYLTSLKSRAEELGERNKQLESELKKLLVAQSQEDAGSSAAMQQQGSTSSEVSNNVVRVEVSKIRGSTTTASGVEMVNIVVVVDRPTNTTNLTIALLKRIREMGIPLISTATSTSHHEHDPSLPQFRMSATIRLQDQEMAWLKEGLRSAVSKGSGPPLPPS